MLAHNDTTKYSLKSRLPRIVRLGVICDRTDNRGPNLPSRLSRFLYDPRVDGQDMYRAQFPCGSCEGVPSRPHQCVQYRRIRHPSLPESYQRFQGPIIWSNADLARSGGCHLRTTYEEHNEEAPNESEDLFCWMISVRPSRGILIRTPNTINVLYPMELSIVGVTCELTTDQYKIFSKIVVADLADYFFNFQFCSRNVKSCFSRVSANIW